MKMPLKALKMAVERVMEASPSADMAEIQNAVELGFRYEMADEHHVSHQTHLDAHRIAVLMISSKDDELLCAVEKGKQAAKELKATKLWRYLNGE